MMKIPPHPRLLVLLGLVVSVLLAPVPATANAVTLSLLAQGATVSESAAVAAAQRAHNTLEQYDGAPAVKDALRIMIHCYERLGYTQLVQNTEQVFRENFPDESTALETRDRRWWEFWQTG